MTRLPLLLLLCSLSFLSAQTESSPAPANNPEWDAGDKPTPSLDVAKFRWWAPEGPKDLRGIMLVIPGKNGDGRGAADNPAWQAFATKNRFALVGACLQHAKGEYQSDPDGRTTEIIEKALEALAVQNGWPQLKKAPLTFWGHSAGSNTGERFAFRHPERVVALASIKGTWGPGEFTKDKADIPYLVCTGSKDNPEWVKSSSDYYEKGREEKALWTQALHPTEGHETGNNVELVDLFLTAAINARLDAPAENTAPPGRLKDMKFNGAWLGDPQTFEIASYADYKGKKKDAIWLPDEETAKAWKAYLQN